MQPEMQLRTVLLKGVNNPKDKKTCGILIDTKSGEQWVNGWQSPRTQSLNKGETIKVWLYQEDYQGKIYLKFKLPSMDSLLCGNMPVSSNKPSTLSNQEVEDIAKQIGGEVQY